MRVLIIGLLVASCASMREEKVDEHSVKCAEDFFSSSTQDTQVLELSLSDCTSREAAKFCASKYLYYEGIGNWQVAALMAEIADKPDEAKRILHDGREREAKENRERAEREAKRTEAESAMREEYKKRVTVESAERCSSAMNALDDLQVRWEDLDACSKLSRTDVAASHWKMFEQAGLVAEAAQLAKIAGLEHESQRLHRNMLGGAKFYVDPKNDNANHNARIKKVLYEHGAVVVDAADQADYVVAMELRSDGWLMGLSARAKRGEGFSVECRNRCFEADASMYELVKKIAIERRMKFSK